MILANSSVTGVETGSVTIESAGPYIVVVGLSTGSEGGFTLSGSTDLVPDGDKDDGVALSVGDTITGNIDTIDDQDYFPLDFDEGQTVEIRAESLNFDPLLIVDFPGSQDDQMSATMTAHRNIVHRRHDNLPGHPIRDSLSGGSGLNCVKNRWLFYLGDRSPSNGDPIH